MAERFFSATKELVSQEISNSVNQGKRYFGLVSRTPGALVQQVGRLTDATFLQYVRDGRGGWTVVEVKSPGQITLIRKEISSLTNNFGL